MQYIYLLQTREFINKNEPTYKIGKTRQENLTGFYQYPKGSQLLLQVECGDCDAAEREIINRFQHTFTQMTEYGWEYFNGDSRVMQEIIISVVRQVNVTDDVLLDVPVELMLEPQQLPQLPQPEEAIIRYPISDQNNNNTSDLKKINELFINSTSNPAFVNVVILIIVICLLVVGGIVIRYFVTRE